MTVMPSQSASNAAPKRLAMISQVADTAAYSADLTELPEDDNIIGFGGSLCMLMHVEYSVSDSVTEWFDVGSEDVCEHNYSCMTWSIEREYEALECCQITAQAGMDGIFMTNEAAAAVQSVLEISKQSKHEDKSQSELEISRQSELWDSSQSALEISKQSELEDKPQSVLVIPRHLALKYSLPASPGHDNTQSRQSSLECHGNVLRGFCKSCARYNHC